MFSSDDESRKKLKNGAEFLLRGGTLLSEPCNKCSGIQVKKNSEIKCIICGNTSLSENNTAKSYKKIPERDFNYELREKLRKRLNDLLIDIGSEKNLSEEEQRLRVINLYINILEKLNCKAKN